ncbi:hypothetical protein MNEG_3149 [Monoraphidium neglectum]|uniref:MYND-type domain-containing protein n=1 Tax=Monoraphidium neglectum TaxID=145388 RepID=A0A0D2MWH2_9CHLO|nr:hypothetical protein MNEG_3149 [Monoraphidium neglectum]KIZ04812.1 hypothetical protein MNEG_3149 [Monoraphidium neglectum]|eukprot:XP_013903831.1 hypothetical protein MNEG_3149 [Monoraphidium neglectum]
MEAALRQLMSCIDSGRRDTAGAALERLLQACRTASDGGPIAAVEVPSERSFDRLLRHVCSESSRAPATKSCAASSQALLELLTVPAAADAFVTEGRMTALIEALEGLHGAEEGGSGGGEGFELRPWLLSGILATAASALITQIGGPIGGGDDDGRGDGGGGPITPAQLALAGVIARPAAVRALLRAAHTQLSLNQYSGDPLLLLERACLAAELLQGRATLAPCDRPGESVSSASDMFAAARAAWQGADADWLCEALPPLLALRMEGTRQQPAAGPCGAAARQQVTLFVASRMCSAVGPLTAALSSHAAAMCEVAACIRRNSDTRLARASFLVLISALDAWPWGHHGAGTALAACCKPATLGELLRIAALRDAGGGGGGSGGADRSLAGLELSPSLADACCAAQLLASIAAHEALSARPSSIAAMPAAAAAVVSSLRARLEGHGGQTTDGNRSRLYQVCVAVLSIVAGDGADGDAWAATLSRLGAQQLLRRATVELGPQHIEWWAPAAAALYAVVHAAHASCQQQQQQHQQQQQQQQPAEGNGSSGHVEAEEKQVAIAALLDAGLYAVPQLLLLAVLRPSWRPRLIQVPGILELLSAAAATPGQGEYSQKALRTLCLLAAGTAPAERLPGFARAVLEVCNQRPADAWAGVPELESNGKAVAEVLGCLAGCHEADGGVGERAALALAQLRAGELQLVQPPSQQQQQQQQQEDKPGTQQAPSTRATGGARRERPRSACAVCGRTARDGAKLRRCAGCGSVTGTRYCSQECCRTDWVVRGHRAVCEAAQRCSA